MNFFLAFQAQTAVVQNPINPYQAGYQAGFAQAAQGMMSGSSMLMGGYGANGNAGYGGMMTANLAAMFMPALMGMMQLSMMQQMMQMGGGQQDPFCGCQIPQLPAQPNVPFNYPQIPWGLDLPLWDGSFPSLPQPVSRPKPKPRNRTNQNGTRRNDNLRARGGRIRQNGGKGNDRLRARGSNGNDNIRQHGGTGKDRIHTRSGAGNDRIYVNGGQGNDRINVNAGLGNDVVRILGGTGNDNISYGVSAGLDQVTIDAGKGGNDTVRINGAAENFTVVDAKGNVIFQQGTGGSRIEVKGAEHLVITGANGQTIFQR